jgi:hypothetical protein
MRRREGHRDKERSPGIVLLGRDPGADMGEDSFLQQRLPSLQSTPPQIRTHDPPERFHPSESRKRSNTSVVSAGCSTGGR